MDDQPSIGVVGAGAWGTALAIHLAKLHPEVFLWGRNTDKLTTIINAGENKQHLPGVSLPENIIACTEFAKLVGTATHILVANTQHCHA